MASTAAGTTDEAKTAALEAKTLEAAWRAVQPADVLTLIYTSGG